MIVNLETIPSFYKAYIKLVEETDLVQALRLSSYRSLELLHSIPEKKWDFRYAPDKWSVRELWCHVIDAERIFAYRALTFARNDKTELPGFDENQYVPESNAGARSLKKIADEYLHVRMSSIDLFESFSGEMLARKGKANKNEISVAALGFIMAGHETHHRKILRERYLA
jgi:hypothetical protein